MPFVGGRRRPWSCARGGQCRKRRLLSWSAYTFRNICLSVLTDVDISQGSQAFSELLHLARIPLLSSPFREPLLLDIFRLTDEDLLGIAVVKNESTSQFQNHETGCPVKQLSTDGGQVHSTFSASPYCHSVQVHVCATSSCFSTFAALAFATFTNRHCNAFAGQ